jgi:hypothetical protein
MISDLRILVLATVAVLATTTASFADGVIATAADSGKTVLVRVGQMLTINLTGAHGSGKYWRLNGDLTPQLTLSGRTTQSVDVAGAPETTSYSFTTNIPGTLTFKASYIEAGAPIPKTDDVVFTLSIEK